MFQFLKELLDKNIITDTQILFIDFSQFRNETLSPQLLLDNYFEINPKKEPFIVFDEIQDITNFIEFTLFFYNK
jgi:predicted AAA+ superfamily ATPase